MRHAPLTARQQAVYDFIITAWDQGQPSPTYREIAAHFGFASSYAAACHVRALMQKGLLATAPGKARSLRLPPTSSPPPPALPSPLRLPLFGSIPAGFGRDRDAAGEFSVEEWVSVDPAALKLPGPAQRRCFALRVVGDSMIGRHILAGDIALIEPGVEPRSGQIVAALIDRQSTLKTLLLRRGKAYLQAENPKYPELIPSEELSIQGVFRALIRPMS